MTTRKSVFAAELAALHTGDGRHTSDSHKSIPQIGCPPGLRTYAMATMCPNNLIMHRTIAGRASGL